MASAVESSFVVVAKPTQLAKGGAEEDEVKLQDKGKHDIAQDKAQDKAAIAQDKAAPKNKASKKPRNGNIIKVLPEDDVALACVARLRTQPQHATEKKLEFTRTTNGMKTLKSSGSGCLDLFYRSVRGLPKPAVQKLMKRAWREDPSLCVKILMHARDARHGKGEKLVVLHGLEWLRRHKPLTYLLNIRTFVCKLGYYRDLLQLAVIVRTAKLPKLGARECVELEILAQDLMADDAAVQAYQREKAAAAQAKAAFRQSKRQEMNAKRRELLKKIRSRKWWRKFDPADVAENLTDEERKAQMEQFIVPKPAISLAGKWAPSERKGFDKASKARLAKRMSYLCFPHSSTPQKDYRQLLSRLRGHIQVLERMLCSKSWKAINFNAVPSRAHHLYKGAFRKHQTERYASYLSKVRKGTGKINTAGLGPHLLVAQVLANKADDTIEAQWNTMVQQLKSKGSLKGALAVCDVSGSMSGTPMNVAIALSLMLANVTTGPFARRVLTFSANPMWHKVDQDTLCEQVQQLRTADWGMNTDLMRVFELILDVAVEHAVPADDMPSTLFIFSDMQFDECVLNGDITAMDNIRACYADAGYECPSIVFWNLAGRTRGVPISMNDSGVALMSGFSQVLLSSFMEGTALTPMGVLHAIVDDYEVAVDESEV